MRLFYKKFHPWRKINSGNVYNAPTVQEIITVNVMDEEASSLNEEWVDENEMEEDDSDVDDSLNQKMENNCR